MNAAAVGASAVFIVFISSGSTMPTELVSVSDSGQGDRATAMMLTESFGTLLWNAVVAASAGDGVVSAVGVNTNASYTALRDVCCETNCKAKVETASGLGMAFGIDLDGVCSFVDTCDNYTTPVSDSGNGLGTRNQ